MNLVKAEKTLEAIVKWHVKYKAKSKDTYSKKVISLFLSDVKYFDWLSRAEDYN